MEPGLLDELLTSQVRAAAVEIWHYLMEMATASLCGRLRRPKEELYYLLRPFELKHFY